MTSLQRASFVATPLLLAFVVLGGCGGTATEIIHSGDAADGSSSPPGDDVDDAAAVFADGGAEASSPRDSGHDASCTPKCSQRACGPDGCGGSCGTCTAGSACDGLGRCSVPCTPFCGTRVCGSDGCGGSCGSCTGGYTCGTAGSCQNNPGTQCGAAVCGSAVSCCQCNGQPICYALPVGYRCKDLGAGCGD